MKKKEMIDAESHTVLRGKHALRGLCAVIVACTVVSTVGVIIMSIIL